MHGFGAVAPEANEPLFHAPWERRAFGLVVAMGMTGTWTVDGSRAARESLPPGDYLTSSYYAIWLKALERQVVAHGLVTAAELAAGTATEPAAPVARVARRDDVGPALARGFPSDRPAPAAAAFTVGDAVRAKVMNPETHTRLPRYLRGCAGRVARVEGCFVFPDTNARGAGEAPQWLYTVDFTGAELWGADAAPGLEVSAALFESYLERFA